MAGIDWTIADASGEDYLVGAMHDLAGPSAENGNPNSGRTA